MTCRKDETSFGRNTSSVVTASHSNRSSRRRSHKRFKLYSGCEEDALGGLFWHFGGLRDFDPPTVFRHSVAGLGCEDSRVADKLRYIRPGVLVPLRVSFAGYGRPAFRVVWVL